GVMLDCDAPPVEGGVTQAPVAGASARHNAALATSSRHRSRGTHSAQSMIVSTLQSIRCFCEHRGEDGPADAWQRIEDRHVTVLLPLSRHALPVIFGDRLGELLAEPFELQLRISQLAIDESQSLDDRSDVRGRSLNGSLGHAERRLAWLSPYMGCIETTNTVFIQHARNGRCGRAGGLLRRRCGFPQIEHPILIQIAKLEHLGIVAPDLIPQTIGEANALNLELLVDARPFPELDDEGLGNGQLAEQVHVGSEAIGEHIGIETVILRACDREAVTETVELPGVDRIDVEAAFEPGLDDWPMRRFDGDMDVAGLAPARFQQPRDHVTDAGAAMSELPLSHLLPLAIAERDDMLLRCPVNTDEPSSFFVHDAPPSDRRHAGRLLIVHAKHTHTHTSHRNPIRSLYWRSKARSPHWASVAAVSPGHMSGLGALERRNLVVAP